MKNNLGNIFTTNQCYSRHGSGIGNKNNTIDGKGNGRMITFSKDFVIPTGNWKPRADLCIRKSAAQSNQASGKPGHEKYGRSNGCIGRIRSRSKYTHAND